MTTYNITSASHFGNYRAATGLFTSGSLAMGLAAGRWPIIHFPTITHTVHDRLATATLAFTTLSSSLVGTIGVDVCVAGDGNPSTTPMSRMVWVELVQQTFASVSTATFDLRKLARGYGGVVRIPDALQSAWSRANGTGTSGISFRFRPLTSDANLSVNITDIATVSFNVTTTSLAQHGIPSSMHGRSPLAPREEVIVDAKTGEPVPIGVAVVDGHTGLLVHPANYDPPEPSTRRRRTMSEYRDRAGRR